jgi:hypothetical protein
MEVEELLYILNIQKGSEDICIGVFRDFLEITVGDFVVLMGEKIDHAYSV